jgi:hypothetical protein
MEKPASLKFTDFEIPTEALFRKSHLGPMNLDWVRTQFVVPDAYDAPRKVEQWLNENCPGRWATYNYQSPRGKTNDHVMVVRFEDKNDALMFKLRGGHQAYENM